MKSKTVAYILWLGGLIGLCGLHRFYIGKVGTGLLWLFTIGVLGVGQLIDLFTLGDQVDVINGKRDNVVVNVQGLSNSSGKEATSQADQLQRLIEMREQGDITMEEFKRMKENLLNS